ncbi:MAG: hypothetical protein ACREXY_04285 [Gammaproteobacteria bacterium]
MIVTIAAQPFTFNCPERGTSYELKIELAGRVFEQHFPTQANQTHTFTWDGNDAYGRPVTG